MNKWQEAGTQLAENLEGVGDEAQIKEMTTSLMDQIIESGSNVKRPINALRKAIAEKFPQITAPSGYYFTNSGVGRIDRFEHLALWYATENTERWAISDDDARKEYWRKLPKLDETEISETSGKPRTALTTETLESAVINALDLDEQTKEILLLALSHSGLGLADFMEKAIKTYANTITGKIRRLEEDSLDHIPTEELLTNPKYSTYPGRAEEMVKRAINAIKIYNSEVATEPKQRWIITQSLLTALTGSRGSVIQSAMQKYRDDIDSHHQKYPEFFNEDGTLNQYFNRKRGVDIRDEIDLVKLVPNG